MEYKIESKIYITALWFLVLLFTVVDIFAYWVVILPGVVEFSILDNLIFLVWFTGKVSIIGFLFARRGPLKYAIYITLFPLAFYGLYCSIIFPLTSGGGNGFNWATNAGIGVLAILIGLATKQCVVQYGRN